MLRIKLFPGAHDFLSLAQGSFDPKGPVARGMAELWWVMVAISVVVFLIVLVALWYAAFRRRDAVAESKTDDVSLSPSRWIVWGGVVMPLVVLTVIFALTLSAMRSITPSLPSDPVVIEVVGNQWWWEIRYEGHEFATANEIHLPVGEPVEIRLTSADVIHSFWVPNLGGKMDALPDYENSLVLQADEPGDYRGQCAEFCGLQHAKMGILAIARPRAEFDEWLAAQALPAREPSGALEMRGRDVFLEAGCPQCHTIRGTSANGDTGPDLTHVAARQTLAAVTIPNTPEHLSNWIADPDSVKSGTEMDPSPLGKEELEALTAYLGALR